MLSLVKTRIPHIHSLAAFSRKSCATVHFFREFVRMPGQVGSICPSSRTLASTMARCVLERPAFENGLIVDLGTGTGIVSEQLLRLGVRPDNILALDISENFRLQFIRNCRNVNLIINDASNLPQILNQRYPEVSLSAIISSLPLRVLPESKVKEIMAGIRHCLCLRGGVLVQFTYAIWMHAPLRKYGFKRCGRRMVYTNLPPALVEVYTPA